MADNEVSAYDFGRMAEAVEGIKNTMATGFAGINTRLDTQNGRVGKVETRVGDVETWQSNRSFLERISVPTLKAIAAIVGIVATFKMLGAF
jgi:hypothetical protein